MTEYSTFSRRRTRTDRNSSNEDANFDDIKNNATPPSRIPIKSPARSSKPIGGMAVAYSPIKSSNESANGNNVNADTSTSNNNYSKKLIELKNAMDLLKTPPATAVSLQSHSSHISYTPIRSSNLVANHHTSPFASAIDPIEISMASSSTDTETNGNDTSLLDAYREDETHNESFIKTGNIFSSPQNSITSSPFISSEELKKRLEATKDAFQRSLEAQKLRLRTSLPFNEIDSSFSSCGGFDSDLSIDYLKDTKDQLEKIKREMSVIIESDFEDVKIRNNHQNTSDIMIKHESWNWSSILLKYFLIFSISTIIFIHFSINYFPKIQSAIIAFFLSFEKENFLERIEETLNFLLQD